MKIMILEWVDPDRMSGAHKPHYHFPSSTGQMGRIYDERLTGSEKTGRHHSPITITGKTDSTWGN